MSGDTYVQGRATQFADGFPVAAVDLAPRTLDQAIELLQAAKEGKAIHRFEIATQKWIDVDPNRLLFWLGTRDTLKIKPVPREFWINKYPSDYCCVHDSRLEADEKANSSRTGCIHVREVLE